MTDRMQQLMRQELDLIHDATMEILSTTGICFNNEEIIRLCDQHDIRTEGKTVFFTDKDIRRCLETVPEQFTVKARNPEFNVTIGKDKFVFLPTAGAPNVVMPSGEQRPATMSDFETCCKLVQTSKQVDMGGYLMVQPNDIPAETGHLDMLSTYITMCDKPIFGASASKEATKDSINLAKLIWGDGESLKGSPVLMTVANAMSPLQFSEEQSDVIMEMAKWRQPVVITTMILAGSTGPVSIPSLLVMQNAEILAGIAVTQLVSPGSPVVYGSTSAPMDMKTTASATGAPETAFIASATAQIAGHYNVPCRAAGMLTDAHYADAQSLAESTLVFTSAMRSGANFIFHAAGQMGSYISMGFEKWIMDEEVLAMVRKLLTPIEISQESIGVETIKSVGIGGEYLTHPETFKQFRSLYQPQMFNRKTYEKWHDAGGESILNVAEKALERRLDEYRLPPIDSGLKQAIQAYVGQRKERHLPN